MDEHPAIAVPESWLWDRDALVRRQIERLNTLLADVVGGSAFYADKLGAAPQRLDSLDQFGELPTTSKDELIAAASAGRWLSRPAAEFVRYHQTSGTRGEPLGVPDTAADWRWWMAAWRHTLAAAQIAPGDRALLAFSFGPFIGFWSAFDALVACGAQAIPGGGMDSRTRLALIERTGANRLFCTPSYALHLASTGAAAGFDAAASSIQTVVVAGEPGGSLPATRQRIADAWGARVVDHAGATEVGPWGFGDDLWSDPPGLRIVESEFLAEFVSVETGRPAGAGELSHLLLTNLGRRGAPLIRYQTGDLVRPEWPSGGPCRFVRLPGGVVGRADDMIVVRGVNVFPSSIEEVLRRVDGVDEWRLIVSRRGEMDELQVQVEDRHGDLRRIADALRAAIGLRIEVERVEDGSLPRTEHKSRRLDDRR